MATFHFDLVAPDRLTFTGEVDQVDLPGLEGDFGVFAEHAPMVALLRPGIITVFAGGAQQKLIVYGGFAEISAQGLTVLADVASSVADLDRAALTAHISTLEESARQLEPGSLLDRAVQKIDHFKAMDAHLQTTAMH